jgi:pimeloyl-ACP methyl ester carboxylesterase
MMRTSRIDGTAKPNALLQALEMPRAVAEFGAMCGTAGLFALAPRGDGGHVVVLPGFTASDSSTIALRNILSLLGHRPVAWGLGRNIGPSRKILDGVDTLVRRLHDQDGQPVQLVGWSLGGIFARNIAARRPEIVRRVITLGSPYRITHHENSHAGWIYDLYAPFHDGADEVRDGGLASQPLSMPTTSVYSRSDGIVPWASCTEPETDLSENVAIHGSHNGLGHNPLAMYVVADRLALPPGTLPRFEPARAVRPFFEHGVWPEARQRVRTH